MLYVFEAVRLKQSACDMLEKQNLLSEVESLPAHIFHVVPVQHTI